MEKFDIISRSVDFNIIGNLIWIIIFGSFFMYYCIHLIKKSKKIKAKNNVNMFAYCFLVLTCLVFLLFISLFSHRLFLYIDLKINLNQDYQEQKIYTKEIELKYSKLSDNTTTFYMDKSDDEDKYYFTPSILDEETENIVTGDKYIISYYKNSKAICDIRRIE